MSAPVLARPHASARRRRAGGTLLLLLALGTSVAGGPLAGRAWAAEVHVSIAELSFRPPLLTVDQGDVVTWTNRDLIAHTVTADGGTFASGRMYARASFSVTFSQPGTFRYSCTIHPQMRGDVDVRAARTPSASSPGSVGPAPMPPILAPGSPAVQVRLLRRQGARGARTLVAVRAARPQASVLLELYSPEHFGWRQVAHTKLNARGAATLSLSARVRRRLRVVVVGPGGQPAIISSVLRAAP